MDKLTMEKEELMEKALQARNHSYCPYSHFAVGAALLCEDGTVVTGCNVESASYTPTCCGERTAFFKAVSEGHRRFTAIAIAGGPEGESPKTQCAPCGVCRQVMAEFCGDDFRIYLTNGAVISDWRLSALFPERFGPEDVQ